MLSKCKAWGEGYVVPVDLQELLAGSNSEDLMAAIEIQPLEAFASISAAIHEVPTFLGPSNCSNVQGLHYLASGKSKPQYNWQTCSTSATPMTATDSGSPQVWAMRHRFRGLGFPSGHMINVVSTFPPGQHGAD